MKATRRGQFYLLFGRFLSARARRRHFHTFFSYFYPKEHTAEFSAFSRIFVQERRSGHFLLLFSLICLREHEAVQYVQVYYHIWYFTWSLYQILFLSIQVNSPLQMLAELQPVVNLHLYCNPLIPLRYQFRHRYLP